MFHFLEKIKNTMFTVGIFTTHLPYVAFVVFYAFFFLLGFNAPAQEEVLKNDNSFEIELQTSVSYADGNTVSDYHYQSGCDNAALFSFEERLLNKKLIHNGWQFTTHWQYLLCATLFSRPPPYLT